MSQVTSLLVFLKLLELHNAGFLHGDVKPGNFGFTASGDIKVFDLGFATALTPGELHVGGSPGYFAPESFRWENYLIENRDGTYSYKSDPSTLYDPGKSDVYSLAMSIYRKRYDNHGTQEIGMKAESNFSNLATGDALDQLLKSALERDPAKRIDMKRFEKELNILESQ